MHTYTYTHIHIFCDDWPRWAPKVGATLVRVPHGLAHWLGRLDTINGYANVMLESWQAEVGPALWSYNIHHRCS